jgi:hypothetical protein
MKLKVKKAFSWAHDHVRVEEFAVGQIIETEDEDLIRVSSEEEGWATKVKEGKSDANAEAKAALEKEIAALEVQITSAIEADAPALQTELTAKREALAAL